MRVKRFTAPDMTQAMRQVRLALGENAVILSTGRLPGGGVEISAAIEEGAERRQEDRGAQSRIEKEMPPVPKHDPAQVAELGRKLDELSHTLHRHMLHAEAATGFHARPDVAPLYHRLLAQEVDAALVAQLLDGLGAADGSGDMSRLAIRLKKMIQTYPQPAMDGREAPLIWALVGPTGVGKTTTVAKLAASYSLRHRLRVALITVDTYRIAATEQLKTYGQIMELTTLVAANGGEYAHAVSRLRNYDLILVDTEGRSPSDTQNLEDLRQTLAGVPETLCHLVLACPTRDADQKRVWESFQRFAPQSLIFTKLDESSAYGPILNQVARTGLPVSFVTTGQRVPEDLEAATAESLAKRLIARER